METNGVLMAEKKIKGRKRHVAVDMMGNLLEIVVHAANLHDTKAGIFPAVFAAAHYPSLDAFCADAGYRGTFVEQAKGLTGLRTDIICRSHSHEWQVIPKRWIVERTFAWLNNSRRLSKDYEISARSSECMVKISHIHTLLKRL